MRIPAPLTDSRLRAMKPGPKCQVVCDGTSRGLYLLIASHPSTRRTWEYRFRSPVTSKPSSVTLGTYPELGLAAARKARDEQAALVARGLDPAHERRRAVIVSELTLEGAARSWDASRAGTVDAGTRATAMRRLALHVFPSLGARGVASIRPADVTTALDAIVASGQRETANRTCTVLGQVFEWAQAREHVTGNPASVVKRAYPKAPVTHHAAIVEPDTFGRLLVAIDGYSGFIVRSALRFLALTFIRSAELRGARWDEMTLDGPEPTWLIPAARMKVKANGAHVVPLSRQAVALLNELRPLTGRGAFVFPGLRKGKPLSDATLGAALTTLGFGPAVHRPHGFRSSASTMLNDLAAREGYARWNPDIIEAQLAHRPKDDVRAAYARNTWTEQRRTMVQAWADACDEMRAAAERGVAA